jgi:hypothetical protein
MSLSRSRTEQKSVSGAQPSLVDSDEVRRALPLILAPGQVTELRILECTADGERWAGTWSGYFDNHTALVDALQGVNSFKGCYIIPNPVNPALLARCRNRIKRAGKGETTNDKDIIGRRWLLVDCDCIRPEGISTTAAEHEAALERARAVDYHLWEMKWPKPIFGDSGNGAHLMYRLDAPADDDGKTQRILKWLSNLFTDDKVKVDTTVFNPARIWKLYGTLARKGDHTPERPHRMARIISTTEAGS